MTLAFSATVRNGMLDQITTAVGSSGFVDIYNGTRPSSGGTATTRLAHLPCSATFAPGSSAGVLTVNAITNANATNSGTATWFRLTTSGGTYVCDGDVATSGADLNVNNTTIVNGSPVSVSSFVVTAPNA